jgi:hypothetical protein
MPVAPVQLSHLYERLLVVVLITCGVALTMASITYLALPASSLPDFFPARSDASGRHLALYGVAAGLLGFGSFAVAAFLPERSGRRAR